MRLMGLMPIYQKPRTSIPHLAHKRYPYLLRDLNITGPNQVWCADITLYPHAQGLFIPCGDYGLAQPKSVVLETFQHHGR